MASSSLTAQQKMDAWHDGTRGLNVSACGDDKLLNYYEICCKSGYKKESEILKREIDLRKLKVPVTMDKKASKLIEYILGHPEDINGLSGKDISIVPDPDTDRIYFPWEIKSLDDLRCGNYQGFIIDLNKKVIWNELDTNSLNAPIDYTKDYDDAIWFIDHEVFNKL